MSRDEHHVALVRANEIRARFDLGDKTLTFEDGMAIAYAITERLRDELEECAVGDYDEDESSDFQVTTRELVDLTSLACWVHAGFRLEFGPAIELAVPEAARPGAADEEDSCEPT